MNKEITKLLRRLLDFEYYGWLTKEESVILSSYIKNLQHQLEEKDKIINEANNKMEELLYLASKCSTIYKNNIEVVGIYDRLKELLEILERGKNGK